VGITAGSRRYREGKASDKHDDDDKNNNSNNGAIFSD
jgi:hypothetical protein